MGADRRNGIQYESRTVNPAEVIGELFFEIRSFLKDKGRCKAFFAPFGVRLPKASQKYDHEITDIVQPDIAVICDPDKYEKYGVKEYRPVHPYDKLITVFVMGGNGKYEMPVFYEGKGLIEVKALPGLSMDMDAVFGE